MNRPTVVVIGAGVTGLSTAYHLARRDYGKIIVVDKGEVGSGSSSRAAGIITGLLWAEAGVEARKKSLALFRDLSNELDGYRFQDVGALNLFDPASWPEREQLLPMYDKIGAQYEILTPQQIEHRWPMLKVDESYTGLFDPLGGYSEPHEYIPALVKKLHELGVEIRERTPVTDVIIRNGQVTGVETANGMIQGDAVVCTVYAWTNVMLTRLGRTLPIKTFVHQRYITQPLPEPPLIPAINANPLLGYIRPAYGGRLLAGIETAERDEHRVNTADFQLDTLHAASHLKDDIKRNFSKLFPPLKNAEWESEKVGLITFCIDGEPLIGSLHELSNFYIATSFQSGGFAYNPVVGLLMAELVSDGKTFMDISSFSPERFDQPTVDSYLSATIQQQHAVRRRH